MESILIRRAKNGDPQAIRKIVSEHQRAVRAYTARLAPDPGTADDLAQEVFLSALRSLDRVDPERGIRPYLFGIARNLVRAEWKRRGRIQLSESRVFGALVGWDPDQAFLERAGAMRSALRECLRRLGPRATDVLMRRYRDDLRCTEIAGRTGTSASNIRALLSRAHQALRACIEGRLEEAEA